MRHYVCFYTNEYDLIRKLLMGEEDKLQKGTIGGNKNRNLEKK